MFEKYLTPKGYLKLSQPQHVKNLFYIKRFQEVHGTRYDYSKVVYKSQHDRLIIICKEHGEFEQSAANHQKGSGCPRCAKCGKITQEQVLEDFVQVHGDRYDYTQVQYVSAKTKVAIICKQHGTFSQTPDDHKSGAGCPSCQGKLHTTVYFLRCLNTGLIKIGITANVINRLSSIGGSLELIAAIPSDSARQLETRLHKRYQSKNRFNPLVNNGGTEFFELSEAELDEAISIAKT